MERMLAEMPLRDSVPDQITKMADLFGLTPKILSEHEWQTALLIDNCNNCHCGGRCFATKAGKPADEPNIDLQDCPNYQTYLRVARSLELHKPLNSGIRYPSD